MEHTPQQPEYESTFDVEHQQRITDLRIEAALAARPSPLFDVDDVTAALIARSLAPDEDSALARLSLTGEVSDDVLAELHVPLTKYSRPDLQDRAGVLARYSSYRRGRPSVEDWPAQPPDRIGDVARIASTCARAIADGQLIDHGTARAITIDLLAAGIPDIGVQDFVTYGRFDLPEIERLMRSTYRHEPARSNEATALLFYCADRAKHQDQWNVPDWHTLWVPDSQP